MKMRTFDLVNYQYSEFVSLAREYITKESSSKRQAKYLKECLAAVDEFIFDMVKSLGQVAVITIDGLPDKEIPMKKRNFTSECSDAAFILY